MGEDCWCLFRVYYYMLQACVYCALWFRWLITNKYKKRNSEYALKVKRKIP